MFFSVSLVTLSRSPKVGSLFPWQPSSPKWGCGHWIQGWDRTLWIYVTLTECWAFGIKRSWSLDASTLSQSDSFASVGMFMSPTRPSAHMSGNILFTALKHKRKKEIHQTSIWILLNIHIHYTHTCIYVCTCVFVNAHMHVHMHTELSIYV